MSAATARIVAPRGEEFPPFTNGGEHLLAELERLRWLLRAEVLRMRAANLLTENQFR
jgi:hypothetical protein